MTLIRKLFMGKTGSTLLQLFRYTWVGGLAFVVDYGTLYLLTEYAGLDHLVSAAVSFILGLVVNYVLSTLWVFDRSRMRSRWAEFAVFALIGVVGLLLNELIMYVGTDLLHIHYMVTKLISAAIVFFWNFFARKYIIFNKS